MTLAQEEYFWLTEQLDEINWALEGQCNDIDCDQYMYIELIKKKYKPVLEHTFSCVDSLKREKEAVLRLLSIRRFRKFRYKKCKVCKLELDELSKSSETVIFTRPSIENKGSFELKGECVHKKCSKKFKIPKGFKAWDAHF